MYLIKCIMWTVDTEIICIYSWKQDWLFLCQTSGLKHWVIWLGVELSVGFIYAIVTLSAQQNSSSSSGFLSLRVGVKLPEVFVFVFFLPIFLLQPPFSAILSNCNTDGLSLIRTLASSPGKNIIACYYLLGCKTEAVLFWPGPV